MLAILRLRPRRQIGYRCLDRSNRPSLGKDTPFRVPDVRSGALDNGLEVYVVERPDLPKVTATIVVRAGSAYDPPDRTGASHLMMMTIDKGTQSRSALEIADELGNIGVDIQGIVYNQAERQQLTKGMPTPEGNPDTIKTVNDIWRFAKNMWSQDPTWYLVDTSNK